MNGWTLPRRVALAAAVVVPPAVVFAGGAGGAGRAEESAAAKALKDDPGLKAELEKSERFKKMEAKLPQADIGGKRYFFVEGDLRLDRDQLLFYAGEFDAQAERYKLAKGGGAGVPLTTGLIANLNTDGAIVRWNPGATLTYCVLRNTFPTQAEYDAVVANTKAAGAAWSAVCNINFKHDPAQDNGAAAAAPPAGYDFTVRKANLAPGVIASAFFPDWPVAERHLLIGAPYATTPFNKVGVLRHELGHVLCFRHEHISSQAPAVCKTTEGFTFAYALTNYDPRSVMHYFCGDGSAHDQARMNMEITPSDGAGARVVYPFPAPPTPAGAASAAPDPLALPASKFKNVAAAR
ncbi:MAG: hypothetical protein K2X87_02865 [Gemmataceae bacterium]|nr:hypothetical protein [Gemmataceae bacterium]